MSLLHPDEDDEAFARGHSDAGLRKAWRRLERLEGLLLRARSHVADLGLLVEIEAALRESAYDEPDDGQYHFPTRRL